MANVKQKRLDRWHTRLHLQQIKRTEEREREKGLQMKDVIYANRKDGITEEGEKAIQKRIWLFWPSLKPKKI